MFIAMRGGQPLELVTSRTHKGMPEKGVLMQGYPARATLFQTKKDIVAAITRTKRYVARMKYDWTGNYLIVPVVEGAIDASISD